MNRPESRELRVGETCWLLRGVLLYEVTITEVRRILEGEPAAFSMYRVRSNDSSRYFEAQSHHRSDLFAQPEERSALLERVAADIEALESLASDLEDHGDANQLDDTRDRDDDDGRTYSDPRDEREARRS